MEKITFNIIKLGSDICRIVPNDIRSQYKEIADGGCILSLDVMLEHMEYIKHEVKERYGNEVAFQIDS